MLSWGGGIQSSNSWCLYKKHQKMSFDLHKIGQSWLLVILMKLIRWKLWIDQSCRHITSKIESIWFQNIIPHDSYITIFVNDKLSIYDRKMLKQWSILLGFFFLMWIIISLTSKISYYRIRNLWFKLYYTKNQLVYIMP